MENRNLGPNPPFPTAHTPLLGLTLLLVEDSRFAAETIRLMALRSGARMRRADSLAAAERHLAIYRPSVLLVDPGLPDGDGKQLITLLDRQRPRIEAILAVSGDEGMAKPSLQAGADGFLAKPLQSLASFQEAILSCLPSGRRPLGPRIVNEAQMRADDSLFLTDLRWAQRQLQNTPPDHQVDYIAQFLEGVARCRGDRPLLSAVQALQLARLAGQQAPLHLDRLTTLLREQLSTP